MTEMVKNAVHLIAYQNSFMISHSYRLETEKIYNTKL